MQGIKFIFRFLRPHMGLVILTVLMLAVDVVGALFIPTITADIINIGVSDGDLSYIVKKGLLMISVTVIAGVGALIGGFACAKLSSRVGRDIRKAIYDKTLAFSSSDFEKFGTASMTTRSLNDVSQIQQAVVMCVQMILPVPFISILGISLAFSKSVVMGIVLSGAIALVLITALFVTRKSGGIFGKMNKNLDKMSGVLRENITGVRVIRAFNKEKHEQARLKKTFSDYANSAIKVNKLFAWLDSVAFLTINLSVVAILWLGGNVVGAGTMQIGDITALTEYAIIILYYIMMAQMVFLILPRAQSCILRVREVLEHCPEIADCVTFTDFKASQSVAAEFKNVSFRFDDADEDTISDLSFECKLGQTTAIIGGTGSGKSTIAKLLLRFMDSRSGEIFADGVSVKEMSQHCLRGLIGYVPQKAWLFSGTIADNLRFGAPQATEEDMLTALKCAQAEEFVSSLPQGLNSFVAQGGTNFSGGQRQRLSIARALIKKPLIYIFDDSFSALDAKTDANLRKALKSVTDNAAVLIIAQKISTIIQAENIIVIKDGKLVGSGTHSALLESCGEYREIARSQMQEETTNG